MNIPLTHRATGNAHRLIESERILILAEKGLQSARATGRQYGVDKSTVIKIWDKAELQKTDRRVTMVKKHMADRLYLGANKAITQVNDKIHEASAAQAAVVTGIMIEKARLIEGSSTENHALVGYINICNDTPV